MKFFSTKSTGVNSDIERHRVKEKELIAKIQELESNQNQEDDFVITRLRAYRNILNQLQASKADVLSKLGKK